MTSRFIDEIRERLRAIEAALAGHDMLTKERDQLVALLAFYETPSNTKVRVQTLVQPRRPPPFQKRPSGPTERILDVLRNTPGLTYGEIVKQASEGLNSNAKDPERSTGSTLQSLVKHKRVVRSDGRHFLAEGVR